MPESISNQTHHFQILFEPSKSGLVYRFELHEFSIDNTIVAWLDRDTFARLKQAMKDVTEL